MNWCDASMRRARSSSNHLGLRSSACPLCIFEQSMDKKTGSLHLTGNFPPLAPPLERSDTPKPGGISILTNKSRQSYSWLP
ncbi:hypothetical protein SUGI_0588430 [Cryptomeria japonica]|nr:hypothetical protein SUGI_0588430 [Cryptomeria japonica]